jgi:hypothetical protein
MTVNRWLIRSGGAPFLVVTCPADLDPVKVARSYLTGGEVESGVTVEAATGNNYAAMIRRTPDGSDPLVPEPGP